MRDIIADPKRVLEIVCAEAMLSQTEILYLVFPKSERTEDRSCLYCDNAVNLGETVYHKNCPVIQWLTRAARFRYEESDQYLIPMEMTYLQPEVRANITEILKIHAMFKRDIIQKTTTEDIIWKRKDDGKLEKVQVRSHNERDIVGTYAWRKAHGLV